MSRRRADNNTVTTSGLRITRVEVTVLGKGGPSSTCWRSGDYGGRLPNGDDLEAMARSASVRAAGTRHAVEVSLMYNAGADFGLRKARSGGPGLVSDGAGLLAILEELVSECESGTAEAPAFHGWGPVASKAA